MRVVYLQQTGDQQQPLLSLRDYGSAFIFLLFGYSCGCYSYAHRLYTCTMLPEFGAKFQSEVALFLKVPEFFHNRV